jgi:flagellar basal-body rod modification protein FlgD
MIDPVVNTLNSNATGASETEKTGTNELQDSFLKMLIAQIQHQDPLDPMENTEFTAQLAQINTVEQLQGVNKNLGYLQLYMASVNNSQALGFIGKEVHATGNSVYWDGDAASSINYSLNSNASNVVINIYDTNNHLVDTIRCGSQDKGTHAVTWQGTNLSGSTVEAGTYKFNVSATDQSGQSVDATTMLSGKVDGVAFEGGVCYVTIGGQKIPIGDIIEIKQALTQPAEGQENDEGEEGQMADTILETAAKIGKLGLMAAPLLL